MFESYIEKIANHQRFCNTLYTVASIYLILLGVLGQND